MSSKHTIEGFRIHLESDMQVYAMFEEYALEQARMKTRFGARTIIESMRWNTAVNDTNSNFKVDHMWCPYYARRFMFKYPHLDDFFKVRNQRRSDYDNYLPEDYFLPSELADGILKRFYEMEKARKF